MSMSYADVLLPLPLPSLFTYKVPGDMSASIRIGMRVVVQFGKKKLFTALVRNLHNRPPRMAAKELISLVDQFPIIYPIQFAFWEWIAGYYMCHPGEVMNAALPSALKLNSETKISLIPDHGFNISNFSEKEYRIVTALERQNEINIGEAARIAGSQNVVHLINSLIEKGVVEAFEEVAERYKPKTEKYYSLADVYQHNEKALGTMLDYLEKRAPRQNEVLQALLYHLPPGSTQEIGIARSILLGELPHAESALQALVEKGMVIENIQAVSRFEKHAATRQVSEITLAEYQQLALEKIHEFFQNHVPVLLHGITSSGKTEVYIKLIEATLRQGKQVLYLLPEIALTAQIITRLRCYFGDVVGIYHSRQSDAERAEVWNKVKSWDSKKELDFHPSSIILGARSAIFLPYSNLGLIIVDEEHDSSYKQYEPNPRYHGRDAALYLATMHGANLLLGSATPAIESYFNARQGKYGLVEMNERFGNILLPNVQVVDVKEATAQKQMKSIFSQTLLDAIDIALTNHEQVILFQNRRGFSLRIECPRCHYIPGCQQCDVTLIYHKREKHLRCHYCGFHQPVQPSCPLCNHPELTLIGFGTEKVEEELSLLYPEIRIARMDLDTTRSKHAHHRIISSFEERRIDVLTGTQMVTKGLDFDNVSLVGILNADNMITYPDFRSFERSFQLMAQVSGRAGRKSKQGKVIIQTRHPSHPVVEQVIGNNYQGMYESQILERQRFLYPPFVRLVKISLKHKDPAMLDLAAANFAGMLRKEFPGKVLGAEYPLVSRIRNYYIKELLIKLARDATLPAAKQTIARLIGIFLKNPQHKQVRIVVDVDPM